MLYFVKSFAIVTVAQIQVLLHFYSSFRQLSQNEDGISGTCILNKTKLLSAYFWPRYSTNINITVIVK